MSIRIVRTAALAALAVSTACLSSNISRCENGRTCPAGTECHETGCVNPEQLEACEGRDDWEACQYRGVDDGTCYEAACVPAGCGNNLTEPTELCDDGNEVSDDGCSGDCQSDEICGDGVTDKNIGESCDDEGFLNGDGCSSTCQKEFAQWVRGGTPEGGLIAGAAYDPRRNTTVLLRADLESSLGSYEAETWEWSGGWVLKTPAVSPSPRAHSAMVYDSSIASVLLFGGGIQEGYFWTAFGDTWAFDGSQWSILEVLEAPPSRFSAAIAHDSARQRTVLFGGAINVVDGLSDTWEFDGTSWIQQFPANAPSPRCDASATYDPARGVVVLMGGSSCGLYPLTFYNEVWEWDGEDWTQVPTTSGPTARASHRLVYDTVLQGAVIYGGQQYDNCDDIDPATTCYTRFDDVWKWSGQDWEEIVALRGQVPSRSGFALTHHATDERTLLALGATEVALTDSLANDDSWIIADQAVRQLIAPPPLESAAMSVGHAGTLHFFGGLSEGQVLSRTWRSDGFGWTELTPTTSPPPRYNHDAAFDMKRQTVVMFGGLCKEFGNPGSCGAPGPGYRQDTWLWDGNNWSEITGLAVAPEAREGHAMAWDPGREEIVLFGGANDCFDAEPLTLCFLAGTWIWDGSTWTEQSPTTRPPALTGLSLAYSPTRGSVVAIGGLGDCEDDDPMTLCTNDQTWEWNGADWAVVATDDSPSDVWNGAAVYDAALGAIVQVGGINLTLGLLGETFELFDSVWRTVTPIRLRPPTQGMAMEYSPRLGVSLAVGGYGTEGVVEDLWSYGYSAGTPEQGCHLGFDGDGDSLIGCDDPDCWADCTPSCPPHVECDGGAPRCGDTDCSDLEDCRLCPEDCGQCVPVCGDFHCEGSETSSNCPGDCGS